MGHTSLFDSPDDNNVRAPPLSSRLASHRTVTKASAMSMFQNAARFQSRHNFDKTWIGDIATYPLFVTMGAGGDGCGRLCSDESVPPQAIGFREHALKKLFCSTIPQIMPSLNAYMSKPSGI